MSRINWRNDGTVGVGMVASWWSWVAGAMCRERNESKGRTKGEPKRS